MIIGYYSQKNCEDYVTLITSRGSNSGDISRTHDKKSFVTNNSFIVQAYSPCYGLPYVYETMLCMDFKSICTGSAQLQLTNNSISTLKLTIPSEDLVVHFCKVAQPYFSEIETLIKKIRLSTEARDRLLPKLMGRELEDVL